MKQFDEVRVRVCGPSDETDVSRALRDAAARFDQGIATRTVGFTMLTGSKLVEVYISRPGDNDRTAEVPDEIA